MRLNRNTLIAIVVLLVVAAGAFFLLNETDVPEDSDSPIATAEGNVTLFADLAATDIDSITVEQSDPFVVEATAEATDAADDATSGGATIRFTRSDEGEWLLDDDASDADSVLPLNQTTLDGVAEELAGLVATSQFEAEDLAQYGLATPVATLTFTSGEATYSVRVGERTPQGTRYYTLIGDDDATVNILRNANGLDTVINLVSEPPFQQPPTPTPVPELSMPGPVFEQLQQEQVVRFEITDNATGDSLVMTRDGITSDQLWRIEGAAEAEATDETREVDQSRAQIIVNGFANLSGEGSTETDNVASLGLADPAYTISATDVNDLNRTLQIGTVDPSESFYYTLTDVYAEVIFVPTNQINALLTVLENPPYLPEAEATAEATSEATSEATAEATADSDD